MSKIKAFLIFLALVVVAVFVLGSQGALIGSVMLIVVLAVAAVIACAVYWLANRAHHQPNNL